MKSWSNVNTCNNNERLCHVPIPAYLTNVKEETEDVVNASENIQNDSKMPWVAKIFTWKIHFGQSFNKSWEMELTQRKKFFISSLESLDNFSFTFFVIFHGNFRHPKYLKASWKIYWLPKKPERNHELITQIHHFSSFFSHYAVLFSFYWVLTDPRLVQSNNLY